MNKTYTILNRTWLAFVFGAVAFIGFLIYFFLTAKWLWGWISVGCSLLFLICALITPAIYRISSEGISIFYPPLTSERFLWKKVDSVHMEYDLTIPYLFDFLIIDGEREDSPAFFKEGKIPYSARAVRIIQECFGKPVEGIIPDSVKGFSARQRAKLEYHSAPHIGEAQAAERQARRAVREALEGFDREGLKIDYFFGTRDGERATRPTIDYSYSLRIIDKASGRILFSKSLVTLKLRKNVLRAEPIDEKSIIDGIRNALTK
ncbi:MAG: hypothetical protein IJY24_04740 [Clostridia bacterium]|nr:hypothetical protein [Clostridia bacterium]